jgi:transposase
MEKTIESPDKNFINLMRPYKNVRIAEAKKATIERHSKMVCRTYEIKVAGRKMSKAQKEEVNKMFREAKWRRNAIIADFDNADRNAKSANVKVGEAFEVRSFEILGSQMIQDIYDNVKSEINGLSTKKKKGEKVGALKFKSFCNSLPLRQHGITYTVDFKRNRVKVQNIKKEFYVRGLKQMPEEAELANAKMIRKPSGLYFEISCFVFPNKPKKTGKVDAADFGIGDNLTFTDDSRVNVCAPEDKAIKLASKRMNKALARNKGEKSKNHWKRVWKLRRAYERNTNRKHDIANKIVHDILIENDFFAIQDEMIKNWHSGLYGRQVQHSAMGYIKAKLIKSSKVHVVSRSFPSTQMCPVCGKLTKHPTSKRDYDCSFCGYHHNSRDQKSALMILGKALSETNYSVSPEQRAKSPGEVYSAVFASSEQTQEFAPETGSS